MGNVRLLTKTNMMTVILTHEQWHQEYKRLKLASGVQEKHFTKTSMRCVRETLH